jgi:H+-transporting ATPase
LASAYQRNGSWRATDSSTAPSDEHGDEYEILLRYVENESKKASRSQDDEEEEDDAASGYKRVWYAPWRKVKKDGKRSSKVPDDWLKTDLTKGLSENEVSTRRDQFGWNELMP